MSGVLLEPSERGLLLPSGDLWTPSPEHAHIPLERIVPRVCMVPGTADDFSPGREAIDLARAAGLKLDPWQQLCVLLGLARTLTGRWAAFTVALLVARQNGKGSILEALELFWLFVQGEPLIGHSAHEYKTAMEGFRRVLSLIDNNDFLRKRVRKVINTNGEEGIETLAGQRLRFMARSKGAGRGFTFHKLIWDEGYALTRDQQSAQLPTLSAVPDPQIWVTSSPPLTSSTGEVLFQLRRQAAALGVKLTFLDYGAEGSLEDLEEVDLDDQSLWARTNPSEVHAGSGHGVTLEFMEGERGSMDDIGFARERLCVWPPDLTEGFGVITKTQWDAMLDPRSGAEDSPGALIGRPVIALDVSPRAGGRVTSALGLASERFDGKRHLELLGTESGTAWVIPFLRAFLSRTPVAGIAIDPGSPAGSLLAAVESLLIELELPKELILKMSAQNVASAFGMIYDAATESVSGEPSVVHLDQLELAVALGGAVTREVGGTGGRTWDRRLSTTDITTLNTVTHALWALAQPGLQEAEEEVLVMWV